MANTVQIGQPAWMPTVDGSGNPLSGMNPYSDTDMRRFFQDVMGPGSGISYQATDPLVQASGTPDLQVHVSPLRYRLLGTVSSTEGIYLGGSDSTVALDGYAADTVKDRIDTVAIFITYNATSNTYTGSLTVVEGTLPSTGAPVAPTLPADYMAIANCYRTANSTTITQANITGVHPLATALSAQRLLGNPGPPTSGYYTAGMIVYDSLGGQWVCTSAGSPGTWNLVGGRQLISMQTLSGVNNVTFSSIPQCYNHLTIEWFGHGPGGTFVLNDIYINFNGDSGTSYYIAQFQQVGSAQNFSTNGYGSVGATPYIARGLSTSVNNSASTIDIPFYSYTTGANGHEARGRSAAIEGASNSNNWLGERRVWWVGTTAITQVKIGFGSSAGTQNVTGRIALYGVM